VLFAIGAHAASNLVAACINNLGPGLGEVATSFASVGDYGKYLLVVAMLMGHLEFSRSSFSLRRSSGVVERIING
jgi:trk system potassium uptake protein TrkH